MSHRFAGDRQLRAIPASAVVVYPRTTTAPRGINVTLATPQARAWQQPNTSPSQWTATPDPEVSMAGQQLGMVG
jgi:hypothetical protein